MFDPAAALELAHLLLLESKPSASPEVASLIGAVLTQIYQALDGRYDPLGCVRAAQATLAQDATCSAEVWPWLEVRRFLADAERGFALLGPPRPIDVPRFEVKPEQLPLRALHRPLLTPFDAQRVQAITWFQPLSMAGPTPGFVPEPIPAFTSPGWARTRLQLYFQDLAALSISRVPQMGESWRSVQSLETRMMQLVDAIHGLSGELPYLEELAHLSPAPDPALVGGLAIALGTLEGRDGLAASERYFCHWETEPGFCEALLEAWGILPNPVLDRVAFSWLSHPRPARRGLALRLLARRGAATVEILEQAVRDTEEVASAALVPLVLSGSSRTRILLEEVELRLTRLAPEHPHHGLLSLEFERAAILAGYPGILPRVMQACRQGRPGSGRLAGMTSERNDAARLLEWLREAPSVELVEAVGWAGDPACLPHLIDLLGHEDQLVVFAAAAALERITGARLLDWFEIPPEAAMDNDLTQVGKTNATAQEDRDPAPEGSPDQIELPSIDSERWRAHVQAHAQNLMKGTRTRRGYPYTHMVSFFELDQLEGSRGLRSTLIDEIIVRTGVYFRFDERALVVDQQKRLADLSLQLQNIPSTPGAFSMPLHRRVLGAA